MRAGLLAHGRGSVLAAGAGLRRSSTMAAKSRDFIEPVGGVVVAGRCLRGQLGDAVLLFRDTIFQLPDVIGQLLQRACRRRARGRRFPEGGGRPAGAPLVRSPSR